MRRIVIDRMDDDFLEELREDAFHDFAIFQHVGNPGWHPQIILEDVHPAVIVADEVRTTDV